MGMVLVESQAYCIYCFEVVRASDWIVFSSGCEEISAERQMRRGQ